MFSKCHIKSIGQVIFLGNDLINFLGNDCSPVPATVNAGRPPRDICNEAAVDERRCICINTGNKI